MANFSLKNLSLFKRAPSVGAPFFSGLHPDRDWKLILFTTMFLIAALTLFDGYLFYQINSGEAIFFSGEENRVEAETDSREKLNGVLNSYRSKESRFEALQEEVSDIIDPSL